MLTVLIRLYAGFRVTLAWLQKVHKTNLGSLFFCNYELTLSPTLKFHDLGTARALKNKSASVVNRRMSQLISSVKKLCKKVTHKRQPRRVSSLVHAGFFLFGRMQLFLRSLAFHPHTNGFLGD